jgi:hypothetical protein
MLCVWVFPGGFGLRGFFWYTDGPCHTKKAAAFDNRFLKYIEVFNSAFLPACSLALQV